MRLIDADALSQKWQNVLKEKADEKESVAYQTFELFIDRLKNEPTIEAEPVRRGEWLHRNNFLLNRTTCSECGVYFDMLEVDRYCPNCGAKMDGGNEVEE